MDKITGGSISSKNLQTEYHPLNLSFKGKSLSENEYYSQCRSALTSSKSSYQYLSECLVEIPEGYL